MKDKIIKAIHNIESRRGNIRELTTAEIILELTYELAQLKAEADTNDMQGFMNDVHKWADDTFGTERTALAPLHHLKKEVDEAIEKLKATKDHQEFGYPVQYTKLINWQNLTIE